MRNPAGNIFRAAQTWLQLRRFGCFRMSDALAQFQYVPMPMRLQGRWFAGMLDSLATVTPRKGCFLVSPRSGDYSFYWPTPPGGDVAHLIDTLSNPANPHNYLISPVKLMPGSRVIDVGACEGAFALMCCNREPEVTAWCFEPGREMAQLIMRAAREQRVAERLHVVEAGCGAVPGRGVYCSRDVAGGVMQNAGDGPSVPILTLDEFFEERELCLETRDLIKIDAEGADIDVLEGARETITKYAPQIAVTTYHEEDHAERAIRLLRHLRPDYRLRLRGFSCWTQTPRPVLLLASACPA